MKMRHLFLLLLLKRRVLYLRKYFISWPLLSSASPKFLSPKFSRRRGLTDFFFFAVRPTMKREETFSIQPSFLFRREIILHALPNENWPLMYNGRAESPPRLHLPTHFTRRGGHCVCDAELFKCMKLYPSEWGAHIISRSSASKFTSAV